MNKALCPLLFLAFTAVCSAKPQEDLQARLNEFARGRAGGFALAWVDAEGTSFFTAGTFAPNEPTAITPDTQFELGSVSKVFTALLLAESEQLGKVSRLDPAAKYLLPKDAPEQKALSKITLLSLTTHSSGLPRLPSNMKGIPDENPNPYASYDRALLITALCAEGPSAPTGKAMAYSNFGVSVLGEALAAAWGTSYTEALTAHVLTPLGMKATSVGLAGLPAPENLAPANAQGASARNWTWQACAPAGGLRSSARDMALFLSACLGTKPSSLDSAIKATLQAQRPADDAGGQIGLGWLLTEGPRKQIAWHNGATAGTRTFVAFDKESGQGLAILSNGTKNLEKFGFALLGGKPPQPSSTVVANPTSYIGRYQLSPSFAIDVTESKGSLFLQATHQAKLALRETASDRFSIVGVPAEISFERDPSGRITALVLHQNGLDQRGPRQDLPSPPKEITLAPEVLREYVGEYPLTPNFAITVTEENGSLYAGATGQSKFPIFASAKDEFFYKIVDAQLSFKREASGKVSGLILHQNGANLSGKKKMEN